MAQGDPIVADPGRPCLSRAGPFRCNYFATRPGRMRLRGHPPPIEAQQEEERDDQPGHGDPGVHDVVDMKV